MNQPSIEQSASPSENGQEQSAFLAIAKDLGSRVPRRTGARPDDERHLWRSDPLSPSGQWSRVRETEACLAFWETLDPEAAMLADAMVRAGLPVSEAHYARLLTVADRLRARLVDHAGPSRTQVVVFDAYGTLVHIGHKRHPFERLGRRARDVARRLVSPMLRPIGLADYAAELGLTYPVDDLAALEDELASIALYPDTLDVLREIKARGIRVAVASNLALPYAGPLIELLGDLVDLYHFSFDAGAAKPDRAFYDGLHTRLGCPPSEMVMVGDTWRNDFVGGVDAGMRAWWLDRANNSPYARRHVAIRDLWGALWSLPSRKEASQ